MINRLILFDQTFCIMFLVLNCILNSSAIADAYIYPCGQTTCTTYKADLTQDQIELMDRNEQGSRFGNAGKIEEWASKKNKKVRFATNAGIFSWTFNPLGLFIKNGQEIVALNSDEGSGNFYMKPNGVFYISDQKAHVVETAQYHPKVHVTLASQSGPLLLIDGNINPKFSKESQNRTIRSAVGVKDGQEVFFAISNTAINFWDFATFFKEKLGCKNALYLDGYISKMYLPEIQRNQKGGDFAALFVVFNK